ncbi:MAG: terminase large subunit [bacterium]|nr:terminase large subunit [bacterium]
MTDRVTDYARKVVDGSIRMGHLHTLACKRHLDNLSAQNTEKFPYIWNAEKSEKAIDYAETLTIAEGTQPKAVRLLGSQAFDVGSTFGWYKPDGYRRFRRRYKSVARQNGKTFENGIMGTYIAGFGGYSYGKLFTVATGKRQARLAWEEMRKFIEADEDLSELFKIKEYKSYIEALLTSCTIEALSQEGGLQDGFRAIFASVDEIHQHKNNKIYKAIYNGTRALPETLVSMITTRGDNLNSFCREMDNYCINILKGAAEAEDFFVDIYALDENDDIWDEKNWVKANPFLMSYPEGIETIRRDARTAKDMGGDELRDFMIKGLNLWVQNHNREFIDTEKFVKCGGDTKLEAFRGKTCYVGLDFSSGGDLTTWVMEFEDENGKIYWYSHSYMPRGRMTEHIKDDLVPYDLWEQSGLITVTGGEMDFKNDYSFIIAELREIKERYELQFAGIGYDPHNADGILAELDSFGCTLMEIRQSARFLHDATEDIQLLVKSEKVSYDRENKLLVWSFCNAQIVKNSFDEKKVDKMDNARHRRIDPVDAAVDAHTMRMKFRQEETPDYEGRISSFLEYADY